MSFRAIASVVVFLLLCGWAGWSGGRVVQRYDFVRDASTDRQTRIQLVGPMLGEARRASVLEQAVALAAQVAMPPAPLAGMAVGVSPVLDSVRRPALDRYTQAFAVEPLESGHFLRDWHLDVAMVILVALPVLILFGPGLDPLLAMAAGLLGSIVGFLASTPEFASGGVWMRLLFWLAITAVYGWFWSMVRVWLDKVRGGEAFAIAVYGLIVFVLPGLGALLARTVTPVPSAAEVVAEVRKAAMPTELRDAQDLVRFHTAHPSVVPNENAAEFDQRKVKSIRAWDQLAAAPLDAYESAVTRHRFVANVLRIFSPAAAAQGALLEVAGTGVSRYSSFAAQVAEFSQKQWAPFFLSRAEKGQRLTQPELAQLPRFTYEEPSLMSLLIALLLTVPIALAAVLVSRR